MDTKDFVKIFSDFNQQWKEMNEREVDFYLLRGRIAHYDLRTAIDLFRALNPFIPIVYDAWVETDNLLLVEGRPSDPLQDPLESREDNDEGRALVQDPQQR